MEKVQFGTTVMAETVEAIERLRKVEGKTKGELVDIAVAAYDRTPEVAMERKLGGTDVVEMAIPRDRDMLADSIVNLITAAGLHENYVLSALGVARTKFVRGLSEFKDAEKMRAEWLARREAAERPLSYSQKGPSLK